MTNQHTNRDWYNNDTKHLQNLSELQADLLTVLHKMHNGKVHN